MDSTGLRIKRKIDNDLTMTDYDSDDADDDDTNHFNNI